MKSMWMIFKDNENYLFEIIGCATDDTKFNSETVNIQNKGLNVNCVTVNFDEMLKEEIILEYEKMGFKYKKNLFYDMKQSVIEG